MTVVRVAPAHAVAVAEAPGAPSADLLVEAFLEGLRAAGVSLVVGLPDSLLACVHRALAAGSGVRYVPVASEADMPGIAAGAYLGGRRALMVMENSGIRQACEPIARYALTHQVPMVMVMPFRGDLGEREWWGHSHAQTMLPLLDALRIPAWFVERLADVAPAIERAFVHAESSQLPVALVFRGECVEVRP